MLASIPIGQFVGSMIEHVLLLGGGVYVAWWRPYRIRMEVARKKLTPAESEANLKSCGLGSVTSSSLGVSTALSLIARVFT